MKKYMQNEKEASDKVNKEKIYIAPQFTMFLGHTRPRHQPRVGFLKIDQCKNPANRRFIWSTDGCKDSVHRQLCIDWLIELRFNVPLDTK